VLGWRPEQEPWSASEDAITNLKSFVINNAVCEHQGLSKPKTFQMVLRCARRLQHLADKAAARKLMKPHLLRVCRGCPCKQKILDISTQVSGIPSSL
jgi:hypothetical protein